MLRTELRDYQLLARDRAVTALTGGGGFALLPEPRTGKTLITLSIIKEIDPTEVIVICPKTAIKVWRSEVDKHLGKLLNCAITVINFEALVNAKKDWYKLARKWTETMLVCDEMHFIKRRGAIRSRTVRHLARFAKYRLGLTGTPIAQGIQDAWAQFDFINPKIYGPWDDVYQGKGRNKVYVGPGFSSTYLVWGGYYKHNVTGYQNEEKFNQLFHANSFRITLREARKTPLRIRYSRSYVALSGQSRRVYDELQQELQTIVDQKRIRVKNVLSCIIKLQQVTGGFLASQEEDGKVHRDILGREKLEKLHEIVRSLRSRSKFIVIARFLYEIEIIRAFLENSYSVAVVRGGLPYDGKFDCDCIVMQIQSGVAVDMSKADAIIFYSTDYSYLNFEQARFRILSYDKPIAHYHFLLAKDTIDEIIYQALTRKQNLAELVVDTYRNTGQSKK